MYLIHPSEGSYTSVIKSPHSTGSLQWDLLDPAVESSVNLSGWALVCGQVPKISVPHLSIKADFYSVSYFINTPLNRHLVKYFNIF